MTTSTTKENNKLEPSRASRAVELCRIGKEYAFLNPQSGQERGKPGNFWALKDITFSLDKGETLGIIGRNGAGKTTLLNMISGTLTPSEGKINVLGRVLGLFSLGVGFQDELTGRENIFLNGAILGANRNELENKMEGIIGFSELGSFIDMPLGTFSQGMRLRLGFAIVANLDFDILLIDEVLAVGDIIFQNKCFEKLVEFRRSGKTLIITSQSLDLIERLCERVVLLEHGSLLFCGAVKDGVDRYRKLLNEEKFFVGPFKGKPALIEDTKRWADDKSCWGHALGGKEVNIEKVSFFDAYEQVIENIQSGGRLKIKVRIKVREEIKYPHFGVAILRKDGVYCYGPNTDFDGHVIDKLGKGLMELEFYLPKLMLAPGQYRVSVAVWDEKETIPFDYHAGCYDLSVYGKDDNPASGLTAIPFRAHPGGFLWFKRNYRCALNPNAIQDKWGRKIDFSGQEAVSVKITDGRSRVKEAFLTNDRVSFEVVLRGNNAVFRKSFLWVGLYRDDGVYCQGAIWPLKKDGGNFKLEFPSLALLPGGYALSFGVWSQEKNDFLMLHHGAYPFRMLFERNDHGTVYLEHNWSWKKIKD